MPYLAQELHNELCTLGLKGESSIGRCSSDLFVDKQKNTGDLFHHQFTQLDRELSEIPPELESTMSIILHLRDTFHGILQSRRPILFDIILYLSDKAKTQVPIKHDKSH